MTASEAATETAESREQEHGEASQSAETSILIINQYYVPDVASTGHLLHELATEMASRGRRVHVLTCFPSYGPPDTWKPCASREEAGGVSVRRLRTTRFSKDNLLGRLLNSVTFLIPLAIRQLLRPRSADICLYTSNPPYLGVIGGLVSLARRHRYVVLLHDSYPHMATWVGKIRRGGLIERLWHRMNRLMYGRAIATIVLCEKARSLVCSEYGIDQERVHVIPNWADPDALSPVPKNGTAFARKHGLADHFTVMYSGNLGLYYDFDTMLGAAEILQGEPVRFVLVGAGGRGRHLADEIARRRLSNVLMLPYQPFETLNESLNACDASLVSIDRGVEGISFPSKLYSSLAVGKPILALSEATSELRDIVDRDGVGRWFELGDAEGVAAACRELMRDPEGCRVMGANARRLFEQRYNLEAAGAAYAKVLSLAVPRD